MQAIRALRFLSCVLAAACAVLTHAAEAQTPARQPPELNADNIAGLLNPLMGEWTGKRNGPGAVVVVVTPDRQVFAEGFGMADFAAKRPFTPDATLIRPGSISKLFTAIAVTQLVETGKLDLDRDVNGYIDFAIPLPDGGVPVTLRQLLTHHAGFEEHFKGLFSKAAEPEPLGQWLKKSLPNRLFPKGDVEAYSNYGFALAGYIVERVSGEPFADYMQRRILDPLGMRHSTFRQPLPERLAPLMAKGYRSSDQPPLPFETIIPPSGALSTTGEDMGRFMRALLNGGELDGARILSKARLDEMMAPAHATPAGSIGLAFFGGKVAGHRTVGHDGATMLFFSNLVLFPEHGIGIFVSRDGIGKITSLQDLRSIPNPVDAIARRFLPKAEAASPLAEGAASGGDIAGVYHPSRRWVTSVGRLQELQSQLVIRNDSAGNLKLFQAVFPFVGGVTFKRTAKNLYEGPGNAHLALVEEAGGGSHFAQPGLILQRVPWWLDLSWIAPGVVASVLVALASLLAWPVAALWQRFRRKKPWSESRGERRLYLAVRLVLLIDVGVFIVTAAVFALASADYTLLGDALDPYVMALFAFAWAGVLGAALAAWAAISFWRNGTGSRWSRVHHSLLAVSCLMLAWFFVVFHIAGTSLNY